MYKLIRDKYGILNIEPKPKYNDVLDHYKQNYFQNDSGNYQKKYSQDEIKNFVNKAKVYEFLYKKFSNKELKKVFEPGFGEGFTLDYFYKKQKECFGIDISDSGVKTHNLELFKNANLIFNNFEEKIFFNEKFDLIILDHFLEHVFDVEKTLKNINKYCHQDTVIVIFVPNDFNLLQKQYLENNKIPEIEAPWINAMEHLRYFSPRSLDNLLNSFNFERVSNFMTDFPIELYLLNEDTDYYRDKEKGKLAHKSRITFENLMIGKSISSYIDIMESNSKNNIGRNLISVYMTSNK